MLGDCNKHGMWFLHVLNLVHTAAAPVHAAGNSFSSQTFRTFHAHTVHCCLDAILAATGGCMQA